MSSWLFGRNRSEEEGDEDDEYTDEGEDEYTSSGEEDEGPDGILEEDGDDVIIKESGPTSPGAPEAAIQTQEDPEKSNDPPKPTSTDNGDLPVVQQSADLVDEPTPDESDKPEKGDNGANQPEVEASGKENVPTANENPSEGVQEEESGISKGPTPVLELEPELSEDPVEDKDEMKEESKETSETQTNKNEEHQDQQGGDDTEEDSATEILNTSNTQVTNEESEQQKALEANDKTAGARQGESEDVEEATSTHEKRSLLVLAAEHDRVDILKAILSDDSEDRDTLLNSSIPPLHISITYGSTNAVQCLLRMGADPSVRPDVKKIKDEADAGVEAQLVDIPNMGRFDNLSAWELAFGKDNGEDSKEAATKKAGGWFSSGDARRKSSSIDIAPSKLEGIRHAFTAEALRCIGSDEAGRLKQLLDSGMPSTIDIGGKNLYDWCVEMGALHCEELLRPAEADRNGGAEAQNGNPGASPDKSAVLDRSTPGTESLSQLTNRIDELESLSKALSSCLDNLAEEVSVCHGLLLMGGGATALASHVRSLKALKQSKADELERYEEAWENSEDELAYWARECGEEGKEIQELMSTAIISSAEKVMNASLEGSPEDEQAQKQQLKAQAAALEHKVCSHSLGGRPARVHFSNSVLKSTPLWSSPKDSQAESFHHGSLGREYARSGRSGKKRSLGWDQTCANIEGRAARNRVRIE
jgi:ankyrin repeat protein